MTRLFLALALLLALPAQATINAVSSQHIILVGADGGRYSQYPAGDKPLDAVTRKVYFTGGFETVPGAVQHQSSFNDGFLVNTTPAVQVTCEKTVFSTGGNRLGDIPLVDSYVAPSGTLVGADTVTARNGGYFYRASIFYDRKYQGINSHPCVTPPAPDSARMGLYTAAEHFLDFDSEVWLGFSVYVPTSWEPEVKASGGTTGDLSNTVLFALNTGTSSTLLTMSLQTNSGASTSTWMLKTYTDASSTRESKTAEIIATLGSTITDKDIGKWTDFVFHVRANPFTATTNASTISGGENFSYGGNRGILQIWKSTGEAGPRAMSLVYDVHDAPVGLVPKAGGKLKVTVQVYKYSWQKQPTSVVGPVTLGFDDIRFGCVNNAANGVSVTPCVQRAIDVGSTGFADVNPEGTAAP